MSADWTVGGSLVVLLRMGHALTIGTDANIEEQDLQLAGLGMAPSHCVVHVNEAAQSDRKRASAQEKTPGQAVVEVESFALCYVNGKPMAPGQREILRHATRLVLGPCSHIFIVVDPTKVNSEPLPAYEMAIREVRF